MRGALLILGGCLLAVPLEAQQSFSFVNFETAPVHPVALSPDGRTLSVCNLPDGRVELFTLTGAWPVLVGGGSA